MNNGYIYSSELVCLMLACLVFFFMQTSKPKKNKGFVIARGGVILCILTLTLEVIIGFSAQQGSFSNRLVYDVMTMAFLAMYEIIAITVIAYITDLSTNRRVVKNVNIAIGILANIYFFVGVYLESKDFLYTFVNGRMVFRYLVHYYTTFGIICAVISAVLTAVYRKKIARSLAIFINVMVPVDIFLLVLQVYVPNHVFTATTYVIPYLVIYVLFHTNPYDAKTGCQNADALEARISDYTKRKKHFALMIIDLPQLHNIDLGRYLGNENKADIIFANSARDVENLNRRVHIYRINRFSFAVLCPVNKKFDTRSFVDSINGILAKHSDAVAENFHYNIVVINDHEDITSFRMMQRLVDATYAKINKEYGSSVYVLEEQDYEDFKVRYDIEQVLIDMRVNKNLDDDRVIAFVQPIYDISDSKFHSGEALMRLQIDGKMIYPDQFIPAAEKNGSIHTLTCIMLNKVCKYIKEQEDKLSFDAITVNFSASDLCDEALCREILQIICEKEVDPAKIRIELTESAMVENFDLVLDNINNLKKEGLVFYLDDFGTGYSNFERISALPLHTIKFDKSLLYKALGDDSLEKLLGIMVGVFKEKGLHVLIEGVENEEMVDFCTKHGFEYIQGYHFSKPIPTVRLDEFFESK